MIMENMLGHLLKGIAEDIYSFLIAKENLASAAEVTTTAANLKLLSFGGFAPNLAVFQTFPLSLAWTLVHLRISQLWFAVLYEKN